MKLNFLKFGFKYFFVLFGMFFFSNFAYAGTQYYIEVINFDGFGRAVAIVYLENKKIVQDELLKSGHIGFILNIARKKFVIRGKN